MYTTTSPVLFLIFNRPENTFRVFEAIRLARPAKLYIAADGPRETKEKEAELCLDARSVTGKVDWECEVKTLFREKNLGCKEAVSSAVTWFFEQEEEGIILEDDCLPSNDFFRFCDTLLEKYRNDTRIGEICGCNLHEGKKWGSESYFFSALTHVWGWASWRRVWKNYDKDLKNYQEAAVYGQFLNVFGEPILAEEWCKIFRELREGKIDTWDYQLGITNFFNNSLSIIPNANLVCNIGFGSDATHTIHPGSKHANIPLQPIGEIKHPVYIVPEREADFNILNHDFQVLKKRKKQKSLKQRIKRFFKKGR